MCFYVGANVGAQWGASPSNLWWCPKFITQKYKHHKKYTEVLLDTREKVHIKANREKIVSFIEGGEFID